MANGLLRCLCLPKRCRRLRRRRAARLVLWGGETREAEPGRMAGEVMLEFAGTVVCRADGFCIGRPVPVLDIEDRLDAGLTYLVVPIERLPQGRDVVTAASLAALCYDKAAGPSSAVSLAGGERSPFEYVKGDDGRTVIKITPEFLVKAVTGRRACGGDRGEGVGGRALCSTPELRKHYEQLVGATRGRPWSPRLETIKEFKRRTLVVVSPRRLSPVRLLGLGKGER